MLWSLDAGLSVIGTSPKPHFNPTEACELLKLHLVSYQKMAGNCLSVSYSTN